MLKLMHFFHALKYDEAFEHWWFYKFIYATVKGTEQYSTIDDSSVFSQVSTVFSRVPTTKNMFVKYALCASLCVCVLYSACVKLVCDRYLIATHDWNKL